MRIIKGLENYHKGRPLSLALGNFDGVHLGHQKLIKLNIRDAKERGTIAAALIFEPHPLRVLYPERTPRMLISTSRKIELFTLLGLEMVIQTPFTLEIARLIPEYFARHVLHETLGVASVSVGFNYTFGHKGMGTPETLKHLGQEIGFAVNVVPPVMVGEQVVSSTLVRQALEAGDIDWAYKLLGYWPMLEGEVIEGERRGGKIGFPTANLKIDEDLIVPGEGVYAAKALVRGEVHNAVVNIGKKPTFHNTYPVTVEAYILDFHRVIYGETIRLYFMKRIRGEMKFSGVEQLVTQIHQDVAQAQRVLADTRFRAF
ncbi:MAG: bifunctional riboflavin kinase/FAD synthetase [Syntrophothermus sp.]|uniref:bifunctional riboflavin kinase/FAD synthetase n=1 Tax=Syntrophothermus sp. TaxID=2736299 RepID=UPI00257E0225|nr:bifunctional riboflavin kinase/FAD synthetase [Syntrophothermus sp.]NSW83657.1 bifunctional riboflavin kinase/FAD synthetase [Syntrophothermus sp.]